MPQLYSSLYQFGTRDDMTAPALNKRFQSLDSRVAPLEALQVSWQAALAVVTDKVLQESTAVVQNLHDQIANLTSLNWLVSVSASPLNLIVGQTLNLYVAESDITLFAPGPFSVLSRVNDPTFYAVVQSGFYNRVTGNYVFTVLSVTGTPGIYSDWEIAAVAGSTLAQMSMLSQVQAALATITTDTAAVHADRLAADADAAAAHADRLLTDANVATANTAATAAAASAASATQIASGLYFLANSTTSVTIGLGTCTITLTDATKTLFAPTQYMAIASAADGRKSQAGLFVSYNRTTGVLVLNILVTSGSGSASDWIVTPSTPPAIPTIVDGGVLDASTGYASVTFTVAATQDALVAASNAVALADAKRASIVNALIFG